MSHFRVSALTSSLHLMPTFNLAAISGLTQICPKAYKLSRWSLWVQNRTHPDSYPFQDTSMLTAVQLLTSGVKRETSRELREVVGNEDRAYSPVLLLLSSPRPVHAASLLCAAYRGHTAAFSWLLVTHLEVGIAKQSVVKEFTKLLERQGHREVLGVVPYWTLAGKVPHVGVSQIEQEVAETEAVPSPLCRLYGTVWKESSKRSPPKNHWCPPTSGNQAESVEPEPENDPRQLQA